jgi:FkbM family methyltransferase
MQIDLSEIEYTGEGWSDLKKEIWKQVSSGDVIVDVGCNRGWWMQSVNKLIPGGVEVSRIGVDPISYSDRDLNGDFQVFENCAVGSENKDDVEFYILNEPGCNSLLEPTEGLLNTDFVHSQGSAPQPRRLVSTQRVPQRTLESILISNNVESVFYVKADCQGADLRVIESLGRFAKKVEYIEMEVGLDPENPFYYGSDSMNQALEKLNEMGFEPIEYSLFPFSPLPEGELLFRRKG